MLGNRRGLKVYDQGFDDDYVPSDRELRRDAQTIRERRRKNGALEGRYQSVTKQEPKVQLSLDVFDDVL